MCFVRVGWFESEELTTHLDILLALKREGGRAYWMQIGQSLQNKKRKAIILGTVLSLMAHRHTKIKEALKKLEGLEPMS